MKKFVYRSYSFLFPELFEAEKARLLEMGIHSNIEHVGSTAIQGLGGKGIIDILIGTSKEAMSAISRVLQDHGYEYHTRFSTEDRYFFFKDREDPLEDLRRYHIHLTFIGSKQWIELLEFRDCLNASSELKEEYALLKQKAADLANQDGKVYMAIKEPIFAKVKELSKKKENGGYES